MLQTIACPNVGHSIVHHFGEGAAVWGQAITPSIAHLVQAHRELAIDYSRVRPGIVFEIDKGIATLPHVIDASTFRLHAEASAFRHAAGRPGAVVEAVITCDVGAECTLKLWGRVMTEDPAQGWELSRHVDREDAATIPVIFAVSFWEVSRATDARIEQMIRESAEKDRKIRELESKVALSMSSQ